MYTQNAEGLRSQTNSMGGNLQTPSFGEKSVTISSTNPNNSSTFGAGSFQKSSASVLNRSAQSSDTKTRDLHTMGLDIMSAILNASQALQTDFKQLRTEQRENKDQTQENKRISETLERSKDELEAERKLFEKSVSEFNASKEEFMTNVIQGLNKGTANPESLALYAIKERLPLLTSEYNKMVQLGTQEAQTTYARLIVTEFRSAILSVLLANEGNLANNWATLKANLLKHFEKEYVGVFGDQVSQQVVGLFATVIKSIEIEPKSTEPVTRAAWILSALKSLIPFGGVTLLYTVAQLEAYILNLVAPETIRNLISAMKDYVGSPTVPLLCFAVGYMLYATWQLGVKVKDHYYPVDIKVQQAQNGADIRHLIPGALPIKV